MSNVRHPFTPVGQGSVPSSLGGQREYPRQNCPCTLGKPCPFHTGGDGISAFDPSNIMAAGARVIGEIQETRGDRLGSLINELVDEIVERVVTQVIGSINLIKEANNDHFVDNEPSLRARAEELFYDMPVRHRVASRQMKDPAVIARLDGLCEKIEDDLDLGVFTLDVNDVMGWIEIRNANGQIGEIHLSSDHTKPYNLRMDGYQRMTFDEIGLLQVLETRFR